MTAEENLQEVFDALLAKSTYDRELLELAKKVAKVMSMLLLLRTFHGDNRVVKEFLDKDQDGQQPPA